jgi:pyruvate/2-oxoglutarate dehydrogenase complex dihydrolipoamide acyltransferase (E2) component
MEGRDEKTAVKATEKPTPPPKERGFSMEFKKVSRYRRIVLELLELGKKALTAYMCCDIDMSRVEKLRKKMRQEQQPATITAFLLKAIATVHLNHPECRTAYFPNSRLVICDDIVAGITVERIITDEPVVFFGEIEAPQNKTIQELSLALRECSQSDIMLVPRLRQQKLFAETPWLARKVILFLAAWFPSVRRKYQRATFGLTSLGSLGITMVCGPAVCATVFAVGAVSERVVLEDDEPVIRPILSLVICYDQRVIDDAQAACVLNEVQAMLEGGLSELQSV